MAFKLSINKIYVITFSLLLPLSPASSQTIRQEKRIYIVDVTASMEGKGSVETPNIFSNVVTQLATAISEIDRVDTEVVIIPFTNKVHAIYKNTTDNYVDINEYVNSLSIKYGDTNIADAWQAGIGQLDSTKVNYLFLLTDGLHNTGPEKEVLYERLNEWSDIAKDNYFFAFYVMLTNNAKETEICQIADDANQMWLIESMDVNVVFINTDLSLTTNINNSKRFKIDFESYNQNAFNKDIDLQLNIEKNEYYEIESILPLFTDRCYYVTLKELKSKIDTPIKTALRLSLNYDRAKYPLVFFTPDEITLNIVNQGVREMTIKEVVP